MIGIYAFNRGQRPLILLVCETITSMRLLTKGYWFTRTAQSVFLLFSKQTGLYSNHTNSHLKAAVLTPTVKYIFPELSKGLSATKKRKASLLVTCLVCGLPAWVLGSPRGSRRLEGCSRCGTGGSGSHVSVFLAGGHAPRCGGRKSGRLGSLQGITVQKWGKKKWNAFLARTWAFVKGRCGATSLQPGAGGQHPPLCHHQCRGDQPRRMLWIYIFKLFFKNWTLE